MIDKLTIFLCIVFFLVKISSSAPTNIENEEMIDSFSNDTLEGEESSELESNVFLNTTNATSEFEPIILLNVTETDNSTVDITPPVPSTSISFDRLQAIPTTAMTTMKTRRNKNDLFFCCPEDSVEPVTQSIRRGRERERNTKPPVIKQGKNPELDEPYHERRPALLLRFFPDGTAVLISKFQLHLHVKPKQIKFASEDVVKPNSPTNINSGVVFDDGKSYEVSYKRLESIPTSKENNEFDLNESERVNDLPAAYESEDDTDHSDHEFVTNTPSRSPFNFEHKKPFPFQESTTTSPATTTDAVLPTTEPFINKVGNASKVTPMIGDSPFFIMTSEEMSSLQHQYEPVHAPLIATTVTHTEKLREIATVTKETTTTSPTTIPTTPKSIETAEHSALIQTQPSVPTSKCLSFKNHLALVLSTEDNIDNSLLKKHILPTHDCNDTYESNSLARIQSSDAVVTEPTTTPKSTPTIAERATSAPYVRNNLVPYLASRISNHPSGPDVVVVTSLPVLIDLKSTRKHSVTDVPSWREVTVGVVRDHQGQPLKPKYNNWTAHLRGLRKKPERKFWNELTTPRTDFGTPERSPNQQNFQSAPSQLNRSFYTDLLRHRQSPNQFSRSKDVPNSQPYLANPPRNYPTQGATDFHSWRNPPSETDNRIVIDGGTMECNHLVSSAGSI
ncbi:mucin-2-like [Uloborus diversus]|uniref:mucin-2-like n=1 Tax=Uloborus diversus TaxID=327109 RepID=UPI00240A5462|nr:mucin-2-like [Uloborus diversus]